MSTFYLIDLIVEIYLIVKDNVMNKKTETKLLFPFLLTVVIKHLKVNPKFKTLVLFTGSILKF